MGDPQSKSGVASLSDIVQNNGPSQGGNVASFSDVVQGNTPSTPAPSQPGVFRRWAEAVGVPTSVDEAKAMLPNAEDFIKGGLNPVNAVAGKMVRAYGSNLKNQAQKGIAEAQEAQQNVKEGGPIVPNIKKTLAAGTDFALRGVAAPVGGNAVANMGQDVFDKNTSGAIGDVLGAVTNALLMKGAEGPSPKTSVNRLAFSTKGDIGQIASTLNDVKQAAVTRGKPLGSSSTVGDYLQSIKDAKADMNTQAGIALKPIANVKYIPVDVAQHIKSLIQPWMDVAGEGPAIKQKIMDAALPFESKEWTYGQLDGYRTKLQQDLGSYYRKGANERYAELKTDPGTAIDRQIVDAIQDIVYPQMDAQLGKPTGYTAAMKQRQSNLIKLEQSVGDQLQTLQQKTSEIKGGPRLGENVSLYQSSHTGPPGMSIHKLQNVVKKPNPMAVADKYTGKAFSTGSPTAQTAVYSLPIRYLLQLPQNPTPGDLKKQAQELTAPTQ
jgi:hypothetical protein